MFANGAVRASVTLIWDLARYLSPVKHPLAVQAKGAESVPPVRDPEPLQVGQHDPAFLSAQSVQKTLGPSLLDLRCLEPVLPISLEGALRRSHVVLLSGVDHSELVSQLYCNLQFSYKCESHPWRCCHSQLLSVA